MVKFCPSCGSNLEQEYNFCPECGFDLRNIADNEGSEEIREKQIEKVMICNNCGEENPADSRVCKYCGAVLKGSQAEKIVTKKKTGKENTGEIKSKGK